MSEHDDLKADDALEALLRDPVHREPVIEDNGFTVAVMARVSRGSGAALRPWILLGSALIAAVFGLVLFGGAAFIWQAMLDVAQMRGFGSPQLAVLVVALIFYWGLYTAVRAETA